MTRARYRSLGAAAAAAKCAAPGTNSAIPPRPYTGDEWNHFTQTRHILEKEGEAAAMAWLERHPRPKHVPAWLLAREADYRRRFSPHFPPIPVLSLDEEP